MLPVLHRPMIAVKQASETKQSRQKYFSHSNSHWPALEPGERGGRKEKCKSYVQTEIWRFVIIYA